MIRRRSRSALSFIPTATSCLKGTNELDFDAEGNLFFTDPWGTGPGPNLTDQTNRSIYFEGANSGTFWRFKAPFLGLMGPGGVRLPAQP